MRSKMFSGLAVMLCFSCSLAISAQTSGANPDVDQGNLFQWCNQDDNGTTVYYENKVYVFYNITEENIEEGTSGGAVTKDADEMKKALLAAEEGETYIPEGEDQKKWEQTKNDEGEENAFAVAQRMLSEGKDGEGDNIIDDCDPKRLEDWMNGGLGSWGPGIIIRRGQQPIKMSDPYGTAGRIARSLR